MSTPQPAPAARPEPPRGWRAAWCGLDSEGALRFWGVHHGESWGAVEDAACLRDDHPAPEPGCSCGFHAWHEVAGIEEVPPGAALLRVVLTGMVLEYEHGFRAAHQRVEEVVLSPTCARCAAPAVGLHLTDPTGSPRSLPPLLESCCGECLASLAARGRGLDLRTCEEVQVALTAALPAERPGRVRLGDTPWTRARLDSLLVHTQAGSPR